MNRAYAQIAAFLCTVFLAIPVTASAEGTAGAGGGTAFEKQVVSAPQGAFAGRNSLIVGNSEHGATSVLVEARGADGLWTQVATVVADAAGSFEIRWTPPTAGRYDFRFTPAGAARAAGDQPDGSLSVYRLQKATWYGPGFFGRRTACGKKLTRRTQGVAHRTLPCGTRVEVFYAGRKRTVPVIDRGPFVRGVSWDLTYATARSLGALSTVRLGALPLS
ncbi:MAG: hypothetical protein HZB14_06635 [Actinobacteria bacterium]|nr:hypothetical protein [Actinomycetota bacterium]